MGASNSTANKSKFYSLKQKAGSTEKDTPLFWLTEKVGDKWQGTQSFNTMEGKLNSAKIVEKEFKPGIKSRMFEIEIQDEVETSKITLPHGNLTYSLINSLATDANSLDNYKITVVKRQSKDGKYWNAQGYINVNGASDMLKWSIDPKAAPQPIPVMVDGAHFEVNGEKQYDRSKVKAFWEQVFTEKIAAKLSGNGTSNRPAPATSTTASTSSGGDATHQNGSYTSDNDDLPF
jgi:hypothetical protein